jgi:predicted histidine transporter YuiF (NhaC family)
MQTAATGLTEQAGRIVAIKAEVLCPVLKADAPLKVPLVLKLINAVPLSRRIPARIVGIGLRLEHVTSSDLNDLPGLAISLDARMG